MAKITILIEGIGLIYQKESKWKVLFPFDSQHRVKFVWKEGGRNNIQPLAMEGCRINIAVDTPASSHTVNSNVFTEFFNITTVHENGVKVKSFWNDLGVLLTIPNSTLSRKDPTNSTFIVTKRGRKIRDLGQIGYSAKAEIELGEGGRLTVEAKDAAGVTFFSKVFADQDFTIKFDNNCPNGAPTEITDFEMLYNILEDIPPASTPKRKFSIERYPKPNLESSSDFVNLITIALKNLFEILNTNLSANEEGVPCHMVISGDPVADLP